MKHLLNLVLLFISCNSFAQKINLSEHKGQIVDVTDTTSNYKIVVDSSHLYVFVYDEHSNFVWKNYTGVCNSCIDCKEPEELITIELAPISKYFKVKKGQKPNPDIGIFVEHCICLGYFELKTGKYVLWGCD